ncbi:ABC transporter permease [Fervidobacterium gondwanense]|uniref:ABC-2 type transport system permease protein n=1 Tax=Fervidobacterium gondwanense DSM 13020 TaxID=1121883 RepID=A0A1M7T5G3_FERGO|nr:ABC transporter permease [Fervidobacterium gondwanense]SHN65936.1 ABC-2 type transport system permease protein [Fervidobacterium gondwanense DSM 13020]
MVFYSFLVVNFRNKFLFFMNILLPVVFIILFGAVFGKQESGQSVGYFSDRPLSFEAAGWQELENIPDNDEIEKSSFDAIVVAREGKIDVYIKSALFENSYDLEAFKLKYASANRTSIINVKAHQITIGKNLSDLEYIMIGVISISLLSVGLNAGVNIYTDYVRYGLFKRLATTPISASNLLISSVGANIITGLISSFLVILTSKILFKADIVIPPSRVPIYILVVISSVLLNLALGALIGLSFRKAAKGVAQLLYTLFIFFSGVYFPIEFMPKSYRIVSYITTPRYVHMLFQKVYDIDVLSNTAFFILVTSFTLLGFIVGSYSIKLHLKQR